MSVRLENLTMWEKAEGKEIHVLDLQPDLMREAFPLSSRFAKAIIRTNETNLFKLILGATNQICFRIY